MSQMDELTMPSYSFEAVPSGLYKESTLAARGSSESIQAARQSSDISVVASSGQFRNRGCLPGVRHVPSPFLSRHSWQVH